ncbi:peptidylprolyl isomerase [Bauldia litoralis]|uniref:Parvulin-like PPIase n=1 Tax=Bauldia litoralis TaxID=665467 RepID=A0A1G6DYR4_9HYPH|nr:peptidylprolyl isomerase [Bauldia litoralis]SDB50278.1 PPIC-type PPIASE domain-containing protein [Bauldia litoralis]
MSLLRRFFGEPIIQFLIMGVVIFAGYAVLQDDPVEPETSNAIVVSAGRIAQLNEMFSRTWQRPATQDELDALIDAYVKEEVYYREGRKLGLDEDDTVFRRRLQQKMEFLMEPSAAQLAPEDGELEAYLAANADGYDIPARIAFEQVFFDPGTRGDTTAAAAEQALAVIRDGVDAAELGDRTMLPGAMPLSSTAQIASTFGVEFTEALLAAPIGEWSGPVRSTFGVHLVNVDEKQEARAAVLAEVIDNVRRDWEEERRREIIEERYGELLTQYSVVVEPADEQAASVDAAPAVQ